MLEELIGRNVKIILNSQSGYYVVSGELLQVDPLFVKIITKIQTLYLPIYNIKSIELA